MKKLLALVLALVMTLSLATVSTNAAFEDAADISYEEAADVLSAVGVFVGDGKNFNPTAALNREQAAKLVAYLALGEDVAEALPAVAMFDDVATTSWAAKYIAYCADAGIITGDGAGKFFPTAPVDGYAFAKMLLCALGYKAEAEGYTGGNWSINVAKDAKANNLTKGLNVELDASLTREEAAQIMFNAIKAKPVKKYSNNGSSVTIGNVVVQQDWGTAETETKCYYELTWDTAGEALTYVASETDDFGRAGHAWKLGTDAIGTYGDAADFVITEKMTAKEVASLLKGYYLGTKDYKVGNDADLNTYAGKTATYSFVADASASNLDFVGGTYTTAAGIAQLTANGKTLEVYADDDNVIKTFVEINYTFAQVTDITTNSKTGYSTYTFSNGVTSCSDNPDAAVEIVLAGAVAEKDWVTVTEPAGANKVFVYPTTKFSGQVVSFTQDKVATMGGKTYELSSAANALSSFSVDDEAQYYWADQFGFVVKTDGIAANSKNYAYVLDTSATLDGNWSSKVPSGQVKVLLADGTVGIYDLKIVKKSGNYYVADSDGALMGTPVEGTVLRTDVAANTKADLDAMLKGEVFAYVISGNTMTFKAMLPVAAGNVDGTFVDDLYVNAADVKKNDVVIDLTYQEGQDAFVNDATTFIFYDDVDKETDAVIVGNTKLGDYYVDYISGKDAKIVVGVNEAGTTFTAKFVFAMGAYNTAAETVDAYGYVDPSKYTTSKNADDETIYTYTMTLADGSTISVFEEGSQVISGDGLYNYKSNKEVGTTLASRTVNGAAVVNGSVVTIGSGNYNLTADTKVVYLGDATKIDKATDVWAYTDKDEKVLVAVFVVD